MNSKTVPLIAILFLALAAPFSVAGTFPMIEASFQLPHVHGNAFDFTQNDCMVRIAQPDGSVVTVPAFFDGGQTWRVRHTPSIPGKYTIAAIMLNGQEITPQNLAPAEFSVSGSSRPGFVRLDPNDKKRFIFDDGSPYYPVGFNLAWRNDGEPPLVDTIARMGKAGINWTRIWMCHWDGKNLDWPRTDSPPVPLGTLNLATAHLWDQIVTAADTADIHFHLVLQHHGQYSTGADPNWDLNPWNKANGGWLAKPEDFFTDPRAIALTRAKFRYIIARWGYSPAIMAWEIFNEAEFTDAYTKGKVDDIAAWHVAMAKFIREQDPYHHLVLTSSKVTEPKFWPAMDYYEAHVYPPDVLSAIAVLDADHLDRAYFYGELGLLEDLKPQTGDVLHHDLWGSLMSGSSAAAQYWSWDVVEKNDLFFHYAAAQKFIQQSGMLRYTDLKPIEVVPETAQRVALSFGAGTSWAPAKSNEFTIKPTGEIDGLGNMASYLQGTEKNKSLCPFILFHVNYPAAGTVSVRITQTTLEGAHLDVKLDGESATNIAFGPYPTPPRFTFRPGFPPSAHPNATLQIPIPAGEHTIRLEDTGPDWAYINQFTLDPYAPALGVLAKGGKDFAMLWAYNRTPETNHPISGLLHVPGLSAGQFSVSWIDTRTGKIVNQSTITAAADQPLDLQTPPIAQDMAAWIAPVR